MRLVVVPCEEVGRQWHRWMRVGNTRWDGEMVRVGNTRWERAVPYHFWTNGCSEGSDA